MKSFNRFSKIIIKRLRAAFQLLIGIVHFLDASNHIYFRDIQKLDSIRWNFLTTGFGWGCVKTLIQKLQWKISVNYFCICFVMGKIDSSFISILRNLLCCPYYLRLLRVLTLLQSFPAKLPTPLATELLINQFRTNHSSFSIPRVTQF